MIVADNNALNSYLKIPPYFGTGRELPLVFEVAAPRRVPDVLQDRGTEHEESAAERGYPEAAGSRAMVRSRGDRQDERRAGDTASHPLIQLRVARAGDAVLDPDLSQTVRIRASLEKSGRLPQQLVTAGGHVFETPVQAHATLIASRIHPAAETAR